jgi:hypothetical protein
MTITFTHGAVLVAKSAHILTTPIDGLAVDPIDDKPDLYYLIDIKSILPTTKQKAPTDLQTQFTRHLQDRDYVWDKKHSTAAAGVILKRQSDGDFWLFGLDGEIMHNPEALLTVQL